MKRRVVMLIHHENTTYGASFPDYPGCVTGANDASTLFAKGVQALEFHLKGMAEDGDPIPRPSTLASFVFNKPDNFVHALVTLIEVEFPG